MIDGILPLFEDAREIAETAIDAVALCALCPLKRKNKIIRYKSQVTPSNT